ncbi:SpoIID/LytB domain protein [Propionicimonas paludicola]|uniref:SpoIID/LytB domain protein n=1 Tax=Propionicimonas paludicola TaxID=185243 RepID=A0A2A9CPF6_9ACTN|nr:SpoIID/LytB domain-containing protein [Propionicimonas paludicola]PFG16081.1 SpoIID/LytB domain protein [Propionicimonas paludicola]
MRPSHPVRLLLALICSFALVGSLSMATAVPAVAAAGYKLTAGGTRVTTSDKAAKLTVTVTKAGKAVAKATVLLQYRKGNSWATEKKVTVKRGKGSVSVKHAVGDRRYRFSISGVASAEFVVRVVPAKFTISGSGAGHGVGLSQYGAYQLASSSRLTTEQILEHYYTGASLSTANNNPRTVKVQVLGPPSDSRKTTTLTIGSGGFSVTGDGKLLKTYPTPGKVAIGVSGSKVTAKVTLANGKVKNQNLPSSSRLTLTWTGGPVTVDGAQGSYKAGNLQVTVRSGRPNVVNELAMNTDYLYGIDEMPASWGSAAGKGAAALRAQAIVARTYVIKRVLALKDRYSGDGLGDVDPACDCHVFDDQRSQNFTGWKKAGPTASKPWVDAVKATILGSEVQVLRDPLNGLAETPFFASSGKGGGTANNADAFGTPPLPYLVSIADPASASAPGNPYTSWTRTLTQAQLATALGVTEPIRSATVAETYSGGLVKTISYTTASGAQVLLPSRTSEAWRTRLGLPGAWVSKITGK